MNYVKASRSHTEGAVRRADLPDNGLNGEILHLWLHDPGRANSGVHNVVSATAVVVADVIALRAIADGSISVVASTLHAKAGGNCILFSRTTIL